MKALFPLFLILLSQSFGCSTILQARRQAISEIHGEDHVRYRNMVKAKIMRNFIKGPCVEKNRYSYHVTVDRLWNIVSVSSENGTPDDECAANMRRAIWSSSPLPEAPPKLQKEALEKGFQIGL